MRADPLTRRYQCFARHYGALEALAAFRQMQSWTPGSGAWVNLCIAERRSDTCLGDIALRVQGRSALLGVTLLRRVWGQGYAREALAALLDWLTARGVAEVEAEIDSRNDRSLALFVQALGFAEISRTPLEAIVLCVVQRRLG